MVDITSIDGLKENINCIGCALVSKKIKNPFPIIYEDEYFMVSQDYEVPISGFVVLASKRHIQGILDFTEIELKFFYRLLKIIRLALKECLGINYVMLFSNESKIISKINPSHFHFCFLPKDGFESKNLNETLAYAKANMKTEENFKKVQESALKLKEYISNSV